MHNTRIYLLALAAATLSAGSFLIVATGSSTAAPPDKDLVVVNTPSNPVPVQAQGNLSVTANLTNTPSVLAQQSGPWAQTILNTESNPIPVRSVGESTQRPFQKLVQISIPCFQASATGSFTVPAGKRLVIQHIAMEASPVSPITQNNAVNSARFVTISNGQDGEYFLDFHARQSPNGDPRYVSNESMLAFADPGSLVTFFFEFDQVVGVPNGCGSLVGG